jgi:hypothetical protein
MKLICVERPEYKEMIAEMRKEMAIFKAKRPRQVSFFQNHTLSFIFLEIIGFLLSSRPSTGEERNQKKLGLRHSKKATVRHFLLAL